MTLVEPILEVPAVEQRFVLNGVTWESYESLLAHFAGHRVFLTYDRGSLELMSPSAEHDGYAHLMGSVFVVLCEELDVPFAGRGSMTFRRKLIRGGLEPDRCFYTRNVAAIRGKKKIDLKVDPPPDVALEVEITTSLLHRVGIYERIRVPELWRHDGKHLRVFLLGRGGKYRRSDQSPTFPSVPLVQIERFIEMGWEMEHELTWRKAIRAWLRRNARRG